MTSDLQLTPAYTIRPYTVRVPNRVALGTSFHTDKAAFHLVSLPKLSIQGGDA